MCGFENRRELWSPLHSGSGRPFLQLHQRCPGVPLHRTDRISRIRHRNPAMVSNDLLARRLSREALSCRSRAWDRRLGPWQKYRSEGFVLVGGSWQTIRYSDQGLWDPPGPPQLAYHGPLAEDQTISGDRVQQSKTVAGTLITVPRLTTDVATTLTCCCRTSHSPNPSDRGAVAPPVDFQPFPLQPPG